MTTDPKLCSDARVIRKMSFDEAAELAHFGAKVLHPATLAPAMRENIPVHVLNSRRPEGEGTEILARAKTGNLGQRHHREEKQWQRLRLNLREGVDSELLRAVYAAFDRHSCSVDVMATSLGRMSLLVGSTAGLPAIAADLRRCGRGSMGESQSAGVPGGREHSTTAGCGQPRICGRFGYGRARCLPGRFRPDDLVPGGRIECRRIGAALARNLLPAAQNPRATGEGFTARSARRDERSADSVAELRSFRRTRSRGISRRLNDVQTAFGLGESRPTPGPRIFSRLNGARAMGAADARIILIVQFVVGHLVIVDIAPYLLRRPIDHRIDLHQTKLGIPFDPVRAGTD